MWSHSSWRGGESLFSGCNLTNTAQYVAGLCHCEPTLNSSSTWAQGSSSANCPLPACTAAHGSSIHPWGRISYFSSTSHTRLLLYQATSPGPTEGWLLPADWATWYHPNKLDEITLKPTIHPIKRYQMALIPKLILEGTGATCNQMPAGLCFIDPPILCWPPTLQIPYLVHLSPAGTEGSQSTPCLRSDSPTDSCLAGSYLQYHTDF